eukprot:m.177420 g.177420  ORF g.177420 m.177420 type:complete len:826 (+) comp17381_c0_seq1:31-2508(+)
MALDRALMQSLDTAALPSPAAAEVQRLVSAGEFKAALQSAAVASVLQQPLQTLSTVSVAAAIDCLTDAVEKALANPDLDETQRAERELLVFYTAVALLRLFLQDNWVGPPSGVNIEPVLSPAFAAKGVSDKLYKEAVDWFTASGETVIVRMVNPLCVVLSKTLLDALAAHGRLIPQAVRLWTCRCLYIQQQMIEEFAESIHDQLFRLSDELLAFAEKEQLHMSHMSLLLERCLMSCFYRESARVRELLVKAQQLAGVDVEVSGALGVRTKFQMRALPQLVLKISSTSNAPLSTPQPSQPSDVPKDIQLDDDTLLERIKLTEETQNGRLTVEQQCLLLSMCVNVKNCYSDMVGEEMRPYVEQVLSDPQHWCPQTMALLLRSRLEAEHVRKMARALTQMQEIVDSLTLETPPAATRLQHLHLVMLPPSWRTQQELAQTYMKLGIHRDALEIYRRLELWTDAIVCHQNLDQDIMAERLVREQLEIEETPLLWCLLGEITRDEACFHKSFELSNGRFTRSMRTLGRMLLMRAERLREQQQPTGDLYERVIDCLQKSLKLNSLQSDIWFKLGIAALRTDNYALAATAYRRKVELDPDDFESWNNLANAYIKTNQKPRALLALKEAVKCEYESWKVWENFIAVAVDVGAFNDTILAAQRLCEITKKFGEWQILRILVDAVANDVPDWEGRPGRSFAERLQTFIEGLVNTLVSDFRVWREAARFFDLVVGSPSKAQEFRNRALADAKNVKGWATNDALIPDICRIALEAMEYHKSIGSRKELMSGRLMLRSVIKAPQTAKEDGSNSGVLFEWLGQLNECMASLQKQLDETAE